MKKRSSQMSARTIIDNESDLDSGLEVRGAGRLAHTELGGVSSGTDATLIRGDAPYA